MRGTLENDEQAHHLSQNAAFSSRIPKKEGEAIALRGNAFTEPGTPHYEAHASLEGFWNQYRKGGPLYGKRPTVAEYNAALKESLQAASLSDNQASGAVNAARANQAAHGLSETDLVPRIPGRINQVPR